MKNLEKQIAKDLLSIEAIFLKPEDPFTWASGIKSPIYCDNRLTLTAPEVRTRVEEGLAEIIKENYPQAEVLMGTSTAGIAHAAITADKLNLPMGYVRGSSKDHGRKNQIEGRLEKGAIKEVVLKILANNPQSVSDYKAGKDKALGFLVGQAMKETRGKANPQMLNQMFLEELKK